MTELEFGQRLRQYRKDRGLTQQELADRLDVSNKTVSRWESGGGYPDVATLAPLARALGVTVDDLLGAAPSVRRLETYDWQNLLSFAFALGGGVLFFLLDLFMPTLVCFCVYLGCMAYGVWLQDHYTYHSRWFRLGTTVMCFFVCLHLTNLLANLPQAFSAYYSLAYSASGPIPWKNYILYRLLALPAAAVLTLLVQRLCGLLVRGRRLRCAWSVRHLSPIHALPLACLALQLLFWLPFQFFLLPSELHRNKEPLYLCLVLVCVLLCLLVFCLKKRWDALLPASFLLLVSLILPELTSETEVLMSGGLVTQFRSTTSSLSPAMLGAAAVGAAVYLGLCCLRFREA